MTIAMWLKFFHVTIGVTLLGLSFASCFYGSRAFRSVQPDFLVFSYRALLGLELVILVPLLLSAFITGPLLVHYYGFSPSTPWIVSAYLYLSLALGCRVFSIYWVKTHCYGGQVLKLGGRYYAVQMLFWVLLVLIIHDAISKPMYYLWQI